MSKYRYLLLILSVLLSSCATTSGELAAKKTNKENYSVAQTSLDDITKTLNATAPTLIEEINGNWLGGHSIKTTITDLPEIFSTKVTLSQNFTSPQSLADCLQNCTGMPGISVVLSPEVLKGLIPEESKSAGNQGVAPGMTPIVPSISMPNGSPRTTVEPQIYALRYSGTFTGLLDAVANRLGGVRWKYSGNSIKFYNLETRTFVIDSIPESGGGSGGSGSSSGSSASAGGGSAPAAGGSSGSSPSSPSSGSSGSSGSTSSGSSSGSSGSGSSSSMSVWDDLKSMMPLMLSPAGKFFIAPSMCTVTVTDKPEYLDRVAEKLAGINDILTMQTMIQVKVFSVTLTDADQYGINWNVVFNSLSKNAGMTFSNSFPVTGTTGTLTTSILSTAGATSPTANIGQLAGSQAIINALSSQGHVSLMTSATVTSINNQHVPLQNGTQTSYLASASTTSTANVGTTTTVTPGTVTSGFDMTLTPHILDSRRMMLEYAINISNLIKMDTVSSGSGPNTQSIQVPEMSTRNFLQRVGINSGETLVLSGFEQTSGNLAQQGIGSPTNWLFGGGINTAKTRDIVVVMITPVIAEKNH